MGAEGYLGRAGDELARTRLAQYSRYATLLEEQESALEDDDLDRFERLGEEIEQLQSDVGPADAALAGASDDSGFTAEAVRLLEGARIRGERIRERLSSERGEKADAIREQSARRPQLRRYLSESGGGASRLDVRS